MKKIDKYIPPILGQTLFSIFNIIMTI